MKLDHPAAASRLDRLFALAASFDLELSRAGCTPSGPDAPRAHSLAVLESLSGLRRSLDIAAVAAGTDPKRSPYFLRDRAPTLYTLAAAADARRVALLESDAIAEERRARSWHGTPSPRVAGPSGPDSSMGDEDRPGSLLTGTSTGDSSAAGRAGDANASDPFPDHPKATDAA